MAHRRDLESALPEFHESSASSRPTQPASVLAHFLPSSSMRMAKNCAQLVANSVLLLVAHVALVGMTHQSRVTQFASMVLLISSSPNSMYLLVGRRSQFVSLTRLMGKELAKTGVTVNCVLPHAVNTDLFKNTPKEQVDIMLKKCPMEYHGALKSPCSMRMRQRWEYVTAELNLGN